MASIPEIRAQFENVAKVVKPRDLLIIMGMIYAEQGKVQTGVLFNKLAQEVAKLPENENK